jgi:phage terminase large subunit-like protein
VSILDALADRLERPLHDDDRPAWADIARPEQLPPPGDWLTWLFLAGRGAGKTRSCAEAIAADARRYPGILAALVAPTIADARDVMVEGDSGLLSVFRDSELRGGSRESAWNRSMGELYLANGSRFKTFSSEKPGRLRGPQHHVVWGDEIAQWVDAHKGTVTDSTWSNLLMGLRLPARPGWPPGFRTRIYASTTPRPLPLLRIRPAELAEHPERAGVMQKPTTVMTRGRSLDNIENLSETYRREVIDPLVGTTLGRQELEAEILDDVEGALVSRAAMARSARAPGEVPVMAGVVVAVDPAVSTGESSDETGIVTVSIDAGGDLWALADDSGRMTPEDWGRTVWEAVVASDAAAVVVEDNQGGDMVTHVLATTRAQVAAERLRRGLPTPSVPVVRVHPTGRAQGKWLRALALQPYLEQGRVHLLRVQGERTLQALEDQLCSWTGDAAEESPDRVDAFVHGASWLLFPRQRTDKRQQQPPRRRGVSGRGR